MSIAKAEGHAEIDDSQVKKTELDHMSDNGFDEWRERYLDRRHGQKDKYGRPAELEVSERIDSRNL